MEFTPLRISTVKPLRELTFDLYIFFKEQFLCYAKRGESLTEDKFQKLKTQKIAKFFITESDEMNYQKFLDLLLSETLSNPNIVVDEKVNMVEGAASSALERMQKDPGSESAYKATEKAAKSMRQVILGNPDALKKIFGKKVEKNEEIIKHSLNVCALAVKLAEVKKCTEAEMDDIGTAALIHDILEQGREHNQSVTIHVEQFNPALRLYERLGFRKKEDKGVYWLMEWTAAQSEESEHAG